MAVISTVDDGQGNAATRFVSVRKAEPYERANYLKDLQILESVQDDSYDEDNPPMPHDAVLVPFGPIFDRRCKVAADAHKARQDATHNKGEITIKPSAW